MSGRDERSSGTAHDHGEQQPGVPAEQVNAAQDIDSIPLEVQKKGCYTVGGGGGGELYYCCRRHILLSYQLRQLRALLTWHGTCFLFLFIVISCFVFGCRRLFVLDSCLLSFCDKYNKSKYKNNKSK